MRLTTKSSLIGTAEVSSTCNVEIYGDGHVSVSFLRSQSYAWDDHRIDHLRSRKDVRRLRHRSPSIDLFFS
jgi:hypothetical protein